MKADEGEAEGEVVVSMTDGRNAGQPLAMLLGGPVDPAPSTGSVKEYLRWLEEEVSDALSHFRFSGPHCPITELVEKWGIVCIDEIDKVVAKKSDGQSDKWMNTDVQQELLTLIEGTKVDIEAMRQQKRGGAVLKVGDTKSDKQIIDTTHILFVCAGAFTLCKPQVCFKGLSGTISPAVLSQAQHSGVSACVPEAFALSTSLFSSRDNQPNPPRCSQGFDTPKYFKQNRIC